MRSLVSAARHQPDHWDLLVPIDPNPAEERWFKGLREQFPFVREWVGRSRLDEKFAAHPDLVRYALQESGDYILERIAEARAERDVLLGGLPDYLERGRALHARVQEISPHYAVHTTLGADGQTVVHLVPKGPVPTSRPRSASPAASGSPTVTSRRRSGGPGMRRLCGSAARWS
ncbi:hypothetical protein [Streptomyces scabiei]|uniref:hypothetical protein n=1 Tax=Streptomyces scabiei TaxID=1930 RepID=UPI002FEFC48D